MKLKSIGIVLATTLALACGGGDDEDTNANDGAVNNSNVNTTNNNNSSANNNTGNNDTNNNQGQNPINGQVPLAELDNDSLQRPAESYFMSPTGTREFTYTGDISFPDGDLEDFVEFELPNNSNPSTRMQITLDCTFTGQDDAIVRVNIYEDGVKGSETALCNDGATNITIDNTMVQTAVIEVSSASEPLHVQYSLFVDGLF